MRQLTDYAGMPKIRVRYNGAASKRTLAYARKGDSRFSFAALRNRADSLIERLPSDSNFVSRAQRIINAMNNIAGMANVSARGNGNG